MPGFSLCRGTWRAPRTSVARFVFAPAGLLVRIETGAGVFGVRTTPGPGVCMCAGVWQQGGRGMWRGVRSLAAADVFVFGVWFVFGV